MKLFPIYYTEHLNYIIRLNSVRSLQNITFSTMVYMYNNNNINNQLN